MFLSVVLIIIGFVLLIVGADVLVDGSSGIAKKFHIPDIVRKLWMILCLGILRLNNIFHLDCIRNRFIHRDKPLIIKFPI